MVIELVNCEESDFTSCFSFFNFSHVRWVGECATQPGVHGTAAQSGQSWVWYYCQINLSLYLFITRCIKSLVANCKCKHLTYISRIIECDLTKFDITLEHNIKNLQFNRAWYFPSPEEIILTCFWQTKGLENYMPAISTSRSHYLLVMH